MDDPKQTTPPTPDNNDDEANQQTFVGDSPFDAAAAAQRASSPFSVDPKPASPSDYDPHATQMENPVFDPHATQMQPLQEETSQSSTQTSQPTADLAGKSPESSTDAPGNRAAASINAGLGNVMKRAQGDSVLTGLSRNALIGVYAGVIVFSALGLALFARFLVLLLVYGDFNVIRFLLGIIGAGLSVGLYFAFEYLPVVGGSQERLDSLDLAEDPGLIAIEEQGATPNPWYIGTSVLLTVTGLLAGGLILDYWAELSDDVSQVFGVLLGGLGGALVAVLAPFKEKRNAFADASKRPLTPMQLMRPIGIGLGIIFFAAGLVQFRTEFEFNTDDFTFNTVPYIEDLPVYFLLALVGMYGIGGQSLRVLPLRVHQILSRTVIGLFAGVVAVAIMSIFTMFLDATGNEDFTLRFSYSPRYLIATMEDSNIVLMSMFGVLLSAGGLLGGFLALQTFGENILSTKKKRHEMLGLTISTLFLTMLPMLIIFPLLTALPLGGQLEAWLLWLLPFALLMLLLRAARTRDGFVAAMIGHISPAINRLPAATPSWIRKPLQDFTATDPTAIKLILTWDIGFVFVVIFTIIAPVLALSFWFWIIALIGVLYLVGPKEAPTPIPVNTTPASTRPDTEVKQTIIEPQPPASSSPATDAPAPSSAMDKTEVDLPSAPDDEPDRPGPFISE